VSRASRWNEAGDSAQRCTSIERWRLTYETGTQRRRRIADENRAERMAPSARTRARLEADGFAFTGIVKTGGGIKRKGRPYAERPTWAERWDTR